MMMPYRERIAPRIVVRLLPNMQHVIVGRFRQRSDADSHLLLLHCHLPDAHFSVLFDGCSQG